MPNNAESRGRSQDKPALAEVRVLRPQTVPTPPSAEIPPQSQTPHLELVHPLPKETPHATVKNLTLVTTGNLAEAPTFSDEQSVPTDPIAVPLSSLREILATHTPEVINEFGSRIRDRLQTGIASLEEVLEDDETLGTEHAAQLAAGFIETGYIDSTKDGKLRLTMQGKKTPDLGYGAIKSAVIAYDAKTTISKPQEIRSIADIENAQDAGTKKLQIEKITVPVETPRAKVFYLSEILVGNNASDIGFLGDVVNQLKEMPAETKPDVIVVSGIMEGSHKFRDKGRRLGLVLDLDQQFAAAKVILDELATLDTPLIYSLGNADRGIAHDGTVEAMRIIEKYAKPLKGRATEGATYWQQDQMKQSPLWEDNYRFQLDVVLPYSLRSGRRLRSAEEIGDMTRGQLQIEEYLLLREAHKLIEAGEELPDMYRNILEVDNIPSSDKTSQDVIVVDGLDLTIATKDKNGQTQDITQMIRNGLQLTDTSMPQNPIASAHTAIRQMATEGMKTPNGIIVTGQQQMLGVGGPDGSWTMATGGFTDARKALTQRGTVSKAGAPAAWREVTTRRTLARPSSEMHEMTDDGRHIITIFNEKLMEKSFAMPDRSTIVQLTDWQTGSTTARPDLQMKYLHLATQIMKDRPTYMIADGDIQHGDIYSKHKTENAHMGLIAASDQQKFVLSMLESGLAHLNAGDLQNLKKFMTVPGNHEYENGNRDNSDVPNEYLVNFFKNLLKNNGITPEPGRVQGYGSVSTSRGDHLKSWIGIEKDIAGYGVVFKHKLLEKGAKGSGGIPVFQAKTLFEGLGSYAQDIDMGLFGHWHHPQYGLFGDKLAAVGPALAGWSGFEMDLGYQAVIGGLLVHLGGGKPPQLEFLSAKSLHEHKITDGYFSDKNLKAEGFTTDRDFDPAKHGFVQRPSSRTRSALQKVLMEKRDDITYAADSNI